MKFVIHIGVSPPSDYVFTGVGRRLQLTIHNATTYVLLIILLQSRKGISVVVLILLTEREVCRKIPDSLPRLVHIIIL